MATLEELLTDDGFKRRGNRPKPASEGDAARLSAASLQNHGTWGPRARPARTWSEARPRRSLSALTENGRLAEPGLSNVAGRSLRSVHESDGRAFDAPKGSMEFDRSFGKNNWCVCSVQESDVKSKPLMSTERRDGKFDERHVKSGYDRSYEAMFNENREQKGKKAHNFQVKASFKDADKDVFYFSKMEEGSLKAITSITNSCVNQLVKDESFRLSVHQACVSSLKSSSLQNSHPEVNGVISTLKIAIGDVERIITKGSDEIELKKTSFKLSVITGLKFVESGDGQTCGIPNSHITACAHLYLSILYKLQKKDKISAKHLLQVFCDSPYQARIILLPGLWDQLFLPSLSHLKSWYDKQAESIPVTPRMMMKLQFLDEVYNDSVDMGTSQVAAYYKAWLVEDKKGPAFPSLSIPFASVPDILEDVNENVSFDSCSSSNSLHSKTMISKRLYESVLGQVKRNVRTHEMESGKEEKDEVGDEVGERKTSVWGKKYNADLQKDNESKYTTAESSFEHYGSGSEDSFVSSEENYQSKENYCCLSCSVISEAEVINHGSDFVRLPQDVEQSPSISNFYPQENENELKLKKLAQAAFQSKVTDHPSNANTYTLKLSISSPVYGSYQDEITEIACVKLVTEETDATNELVGSWSLKKKSRDLMLGDHEESAQDSLFSRIPKEFICPLTGHLLMDPVTLESGYTFELAAIQDLFNKGKRACPVTGQLLNSSPIPDTNSVLKCMINKWMKDCFSYSISIASESTVGPLKQAFNSNYELCLLIIEQHLTGFSSKEVKENIEHLIFLGGLQFLTHMFKIGSVEEKSRAAEVLIQCIQADGCYRSHIAMDISKSSILELIHCKQVHARKNAASLLIELISINRRIDVMSFVSELITEDIGNTKHELLLCLECFLPEERVLVAVLLLHLDYMEKSKTYSVYQKEAVKCIIWTLDCCLSNKKFIANCRRALLMLGGHLSYSGEVLIESWLLKKAGYYCKTLSSSDEDDQTISEEESRTREEWLSSMASILLRCGKNSFQSALSRCWKSGEPDLVKMCVATTAWLCHALPSLHFPAIQLSAFSALAPCLKECLNSDPVVEHRVLASSSLLNFSKILECRIPLISCADEIHYPLKSLKKVTWTAECLYDDFFGENP